MGQGNPIHAGVGNKFQAEQDYSDQPSFARVYNSAAASGTGALGQRQWSSSYSQFLFPVPGQDAISAFRADGRRFDFILQNGAWVGDSDVPDRLTQVTGGTGWRYSAMNEGVVELYDSLGKLLSVTDRAGRTSTVVYDASNRLSSISDFAARRLQLGYDASNRVATVTQPDEKIIQFTYDGIGNLAGATYPDQSTRQYLYEDGRFPASLTGIIDENGVRYATWNYQSDGKAISSSHAGGVDYTTLSYGIGSTRVTNALGTARSLNLQTILGAVKSTGVSQPGGSGCGASSSNISYDANGNVVSRTDFDGHVTTYTYDPSRNVELTRVEGSGTSAARMISTAWHPDWRLEAKRAEPKKVTTWVYNGQPDPYAGNAVASCAPAGALLPDGKPIAVLCKKIEQATTDATGAAGFGATTTGSARVSIWTYNGFGQMLTAKGPRTDANDTTSYVYYPSTDYSSADGHTLGDLWKVTNPAGHVTEYLAYDKNGRLLKMKDANGLVTTMTYTPRGWLKTRQVGDELTTHDYDAVGQLKKVTAPDGSWIGFDYDPAHRLVAIYDNQNNKITYTLDNAGNRIKEEATDPAGYLVRTQARVYDALSRLQNVVQPQ